MKVLFLGTPQFAVYSLRALLSSGHEVVGVVTQPDRALKRGKTEKSAVKQAAEQAGVAVFQPDRIKNNVPELKAFGADVAVTAAYGQILTQSVIDCFEHGVINVHASLLPAYRGASPIQSAIAAGEKVTGVTIMQTDIGIDTGDIIAARTVDISDDDNAGTLTDKLGAVGAQLLVQTLDDWDSVTRTKQNNAVATHCRMISKAEEYVDFCGDARDIVNKIRSLSPAPCAKTAIMGEVYKLYRARVAAGEYSAPAGTVVKSDGALVVCCGSGAVEITELQPPSKRAMTAADFLRGHKIPVGVTCAKP